MIDWIKKNFTFPAFLSLVLLGVGSAVYIQVQGQAIRQLQVAMVEFSEDLAKMRDDLNRVERYGSDVSKEHIARAERQMTALEVRVKDVETYNSAINVILSRLGYIEASLNELKSRPYVQTP